MYSYLIFIINSNIVTIIIIIIIVILAILSNKRCWKFLLNYISHPIPRRFLIESNCDKSWAGVKIRFINFNREKSKIFT
jgi:hypothetical protein